MLVFLIDMADMFLVAYLMGILCEEINKKKVAAALVVLAVCASGTLDFIWFISSGLLCRFLLLGLFMRGKFIQKCLWCMELQLLIVMFDFVLINIKLIIQDIYNGQNIQQNQDFQNLYIIRGLLIFIFVLIFLKKRSYIAEVFGKTDRNFSVYMFIGIGINITILVLVYMCLRGEYLETVIPIFSSGIILFSILQIILCVMVRILLYSRKKLQVLNEMNQEYIKQQKEYYEEMNKKNIELESFRHDFNEYIYTMNDMAAREEIKELQKYLADLSKKKETMYYLNTGNHVANAVINRYYDMAAGQGIIFKCTGRWTESLYGITDVEICSVLSNILKNAFEAVVRVPEDRERKIIIEMGRDVMHEYIFLENTAIGYEESGGKLITYKKDKEHHGIGMKNVRNIMEKYGGTLEWKYENGIFYTWVYFLMEEITS